MAGMAASAQAGDHRVSGAVCELVVAHAGHQEDGRPPGASQACRKGRDKLPLIPISLDNPMKQCRYKRRL